MNIIDRIIEALTPGRPRTATPDEPPVDIPSHTSAGRLFGRRPLTLAESEYLRRQIRARTDAIRRELDALDRIDDEVPP